MGKLRKKIAAAMELPEAALGACPYLSVESNSSIKIDECSEILSYDEGEVRLRLRGMTAAVFGEGLIMKSYAGGVIRIVGIIRRIDLSDEL